MKPINYSLPIPSDPMADHFLAIPSRHAPDRDLDEAQRLAHRAWLAEPGDPEASCPPHLQLETNQRRFITLFINDYLYGQHA